MIKYFSKKNWKRNLAIAPLVLLVSLPFSIVVFTPLMVCHALFEWLDDCVFDLFPWFKAD